jgi:hypothetical protein
MGVERRGSISMGMKIRRELISVWVDVTVYLRGGDVGNILQGWRGGGAYLRGEGRRGLISVWEDVKAYLIGGDE